MANIVGPGIPILALTILEICSKANRFISNPQELSLEFIHGYRGFDTRNNLHYLPEGDIVYHAAGAGIVLSTANGVQSFYLEHTDDIICLAVNQHPKFKVRRFFKIFFCFRGPEFLNTITLSWQKLLYIGYFFLLLLFTVFFINIPRLCAEKLSRYTN